MCFTHTRSSLQVTWWVRQTQHLSATWNWALWEAWVMTMICTWGETWACLMTRDSNRSEDQILTRRSVQLFAVEIFGLCVILTVPINDCESPLEFLNSVRKTLWSARSLCVPECLLSVKNLVTLDQMTNKCQGSKHGQGFIWSLKHRRAKENFIPVYGKALIAVYIYLNTDIWKQVTVVKRSEHWIELLSRENCMKKESTEMAFGCKTPLKRMFFFSLYTEILHFINKIQKPSQNFRLHQITHKLD